MKMHEAAEMYLETIEVLSRRIKNVRSVDIANEMNYSKPTVSVVMKEFREDGYIDVDGNGYITLTEKGKEIAERIYDRHEWIAKFLMSLGVDKETATIDACKMEHDISDQTFDCMKKHYQKHHEQ